ncbi:MAG: hypothetical protein ACYC0F_19670, partial [Rhodanobacter sp.]
MTEDDQGLKDRFQRMRADDAAWTPSFERVRSRRPVRRRRWVPMVALGAAAAVVALALVTRHRPSPVAAPFTIAVGDLRMPTDFLLDIQSVP